MKRNKHDVEAGFFDIREVVVRNRRYDCDIVNVQERTLTARLFLVRGRNENFTR